jgi:hypothetical protein
LTLLVSVFVADLPRTPSPRRQPLFEYPFSNADASQIFAEFRRNSTAGARNARDFHAGGVKLTHFAASKLPQAAALHVPSACNR